MSKHTVVDLAGRDTPADPLTELLRTGARQLIQQAVEVELQELLGEYAQRRTEDGRAGVVRKWVSAGTGAADGRWPCHGADSQGSVQDR